MTSMFLTERIGFARVLARAGRRPRQDIGHEYRLRGGEEREAAIAACPHALGYSHALFAQLSLEQSRASIFFSAAYLAETSLTSGSVIS